MIISDEGIQLIKKFEGCKLEAYLCPAGVWTIGYGHTGQDVVEGLSITDHQADALLQHDLARFERCVDNYVQVAITQAQFDALVSFALNLGCESLKKSTLLRMLNDGDDVGASLQFERWNRAGGKVLAGLTRRREAERDLFLT
ncbi:MAG: lysozyme [Pseudomonadota bacterium]